MIVTDNTTLIEFFQQIFKILLTNYVIRSNIVYCIKELVSRDRVYVTALNHCLEDQEFDYKNSPLNVKNR